MEHRQELSKHRLEEAGRCLRSARLLYEAEDYKSAANRSYYCVFNAIRSIFALQGRDYKRHSALISAFIKEFIKTQIFDDRMSDILRDLFNIRGKSDYDDFYVLDKQDISEQIDNAGYFFEQVRMFLKLSDGLGAEAVSGAP